MIPTGSYWLDEQLGGGWPIGQVSEIYGDPGVGTSTLAMHALVAATGRGPCLYLEWGNSFDYPYAHEIGVDVTQLMVATDIGVLRIVGDIPLIVIDQPWVPPGLIPEDQTVLLVGRGHPSKRATVQVRMRDGSIWKGGQSVVIEVGTASSRLHLHYGKGFSRVEEVLMLAVERGIVNRKGTHYYLDEQYLGPSWGELVRAAQQHPWILHDLERLLRQP